MNESELENQLRALRPARPSEELERSIAWALQPKRVATSRPRQTTHWMAWIMERLAWSAAGALGLWLLQVTLHRPDAVVAAAPAIPQQVIEPDEVTEQPVAIRDEGVTFLESGEPARLVRYLTMEHHPLTDGAEVRMPREDLIVLPVKMQ